MTVVEVRSYSPGVGAMSLESVQYTLGAMRATIALIFRSLVGL